MASNNDITGNIGAVGFIIALALTITGVISLMVYNTWPIELFLRQFVPAFYLLCCLYLAVGTEQRVKLRHVFGFGVAGSIAYMTLNQTYWEWLPLWGTSDTWLILTLLTMLGVGAWIFSLVVETEQIDGPWERVNHFIDWVNKKL